MKKLGKIIGLILVFLSLAPNVSAAEYYFNPHFIITEDDMFDHDSMNLTDIQGFLERKGSALAFKSFPDFSGVTRKASEIIWQAARESFVNPKVLLVTLQKEQSLIEDPNPSLSQYDKATGYRCPDGGSCNPKAAGFGKQVDGLAWQLRQYYDNPNDWFFKVGNEYSIDGYFITPVNQATANLYNYTPHYSGNLSFWRIWQKYFGKDFPDGSLLKASNSPDVWLIKYGTKRRIESWGALISRFDPKKIITVSATDLEKYETGPAIKFRNYSLLALPDGKTYLVVGDELRYITSPEVFRIIGFNPEEIELVDESDLAGYKFGSDITTETAYPTGALLQHNQTGGVYFVENAVKYPIYSKEIMKANFPNRVLTQVSPEILDQYPGGAPVRFKDGEIIKAFDDPRVYVIADGHRVWIKDAESFANFGYRWDNIIATSQKAVDLHPLGDVIELN